MAQWTIYYNPKCGTCRNTLEILKSKKIEPKIVEYLKNPPSQAELETIIQAVGGNAQEIVRAKEDEYAQEKLSENSSNDRIVKAILKHPILLQRPIVIKDKKGVVARPPEKVNELF